MGTPITVAATAECDSDDKYGHHHTHHVCIVVNNKRIEAPNPITVAALKELVHLPLTTLCYRVVHNKNHGPLPNDEVLELHHDERFAILHGEDPS